MTILELLERLQDAVENIGEAAAETTEVRLMTQENWPFENSIQGVCAKSDLVDESQTGEAEDDDPQTSEDEAEIIYLVEGTQLCYGNKNAWDAAR